MAHGGPVLGLCGPWPPRAGPCRRRPRPTTSTRREALSPTAGAPARPWARGRRRHVLRGREHIHHTADGAGRSRSSPGTGRYRAALRRVALSVRPGARWRAGPVADRTRAASAPAAGPAAGPVELIDKIGGAPRVVAARSAGLLSVLMSHSRGLEDRRGSANSDGKHQRTRLIAQRPQKAGHSAKVRLRSQCYIYHLIYGAI